MRKLTVIYFFFLSIFIFLFINFETNLNSLSKNNEKSKMVACTDLDYDLAQYIHPKNFKKFNIE